MSTVLEDHALARDARRNWRPWALVLAGLACLYIPTYVDLARGLWRDDAYAHGPIVVAVFAWLVWRARDVLFAPPVRRSPVAGAILFASGLALYLVGRTQSLTVLEVASHLPVIAGIVLMLAGMPAIRRLAFPLFFLLFLIPLPGFMLDAVTTPLKDLVSVAVEALLQFAGYPVERSGVVLTIGQHELLIADACSGLNSLYSLFALGILYTHLTTGTRTRTLLVLASIVPIAIVANIVRVAFLVLVTYHFGDQAAEGFVHAFAGMLVFVSAFALLVGFDWMVKRWLPGNTHPSLEGEGRHGRAGEVRHSRVGGNPISPKIALGAALCMASVALATPALKPVPASGNEINLEKAIPLAFGGWRIDPDEVQVTPAPDVQANLDRLYSQIVSRTYVNAAGERMMVTVAYGGDQSDALKAHRQEACYAAQGFQIGSLEHGTLDVAGRSIPVTRMFAVRGERSEPVTYWFTMGDRVVLGRAERLRVQLENGLAGRIPDGMLVRVSNLSNDAPRAFAAQQSFVAALIAAIPAADANRFVGASRN